MVETEEEGKKLVDIFTKILQLTTHNGALVYKAASLFYKRLKFKQLPNSPKKKIVDPKNLISIEDWNEYYIKPFRKKYNFIKKHNDILQDSYHEFHRSLTLALELELPKEYHPYIKFCKNYSYEEYDFMVEKLEIVKV